MGNSDPFEILAGPADIYVAPIGTAFPLVNVAPAVDWVHPGARFQVASSPRHAPSMPAACASPARAQCARDRHLARP